MKKNQKKYRIKRKEEEEKKQEQCTKTRMMDKRMANVNRSVACAPCIHEPIRVFALRLILSFQCDFNHMHMCKILFNTHADTESHSMDHRSYNETKRHNIESLCWCVFASHSRYKCVYVCVHLCVFDHQQNRMVIELWLIRWAHTMATIYILIIVIIIMLMNMRANIMMMYVWIESMCTSAAACWWSKELRTRVIKILRVYSSEVLARVHVK